MSFRARGDDASGSGDESAAAVDLDALELEELEDAAFLRRETAADDAIPRPPRRPLHRSDSAAAVGDAGDGQTSRLLEALEALSSETGGAMPPSLRSLLGQLQGDESAMAGLFPFMQLLDSHGSHPRFQRMLQSIDADAPAHVQLSGLSDLCESLSMSSEESLVVSGFSVDKFLPPVMQLVRAPATMEVLLLAARALSAMFDLFPTVAIPKAMAAGPALVDSICAKLLEIEYMDVAELAFQILERIVFSPQSEPLAAEYRRTLIAANSFVALLQFVDFFPIENQRTAARVVAGLCRNIGADSMSELQIALPLIAGLLRSADAEIVQHGCKSFQAMSASSAFAADQEFALLVANDETCATLAQLLDAFVRRGDEDHADAGSTTPQLSVSACAGVLQFMSATLSSPHELMVDQVKQLRFTRLPPTVAKLLAAQTIIDDVSLLRETLKLVSAILPPAHDIEDVEGSENQQTTLRSFVRAILPCVIQVYEVSGRKDVRYDCLGAILRVCLMQQHIEHTEEDFAELGHLSSFLARILRPEGVSEQSVKAEHRISCVALQIVQACLHSDSSISSFTKGLFDRHGVGAAIRRLANAKEANEVNGVRALAKLLVSEYLGEHDESNEPSMEQLRSTVELLQTALADLSDRRSEALAGGLRGLLATCRERQESSQSAEVWLTAHEIASSGLSRALTQLLQDSEGRHVFVQIFLSESGESAAAKFVDGLVSSVQDAISAEKDAFRVDACHGGSAVALSTGSVTSDMDQLTQHIKVKVKIEDIENIASNLDVKRKRRSVHDTVVLVEPLARIDTIEEFISEKLFGSRAPLGVLEDELLGPRRRRRSRSRESDAEEKHSDADEEDIEGDHEVEHEAGQEERQEDENDDLRSDRPQKQKCLQVLYNGSVMRGDSSVLEAILKKNATDDGESGGRSNLAKIWTGSPHEFVFRVIRKEPSKIESQKAGEEIAFSAVSNVDPESPTLSEGVSSQPKRWDDVWDLLEILKHLHELLGGSVETQFVNAYISLQIHRALAQPVRVMTNQLPSWSFRVVEEYPFVLDYDTRFDFVYATTSGAPRAIAYLCRTLWKKAAMAEDPAPLATGGRDVSRSSRRMARDRNGGPASRNATAALANLSRMAKLPRLKVRVARSRLLQSAMKLFTMYGGKKAIIEIEFLGEVGTGLGPTTEFYTLVCHEIQASHLKLWRNDKDVLTDEDEGEDAACADVAAKKKKQDTDKTKKPGLPVRGYHRVAVYHCARCKHLEIPRCAIHDMLLTHEKSDSDDGVQSSTASIPQCSKCLDTQDWHAAHVTCKSCVIVKPMVESTIVAAAAAASEDATEERRESKVVDGAKQCVLRWWILSEEEVRYLHKVYPRDVETIKHPVLQCSHCDTVNFPGTDAGIVVLDHTGERMVSHAGRRMYERDYRAVTKHVSPLCEGTPLKQIGVVLTRDVVETLVDCTKKSPELLDSEVESLTYMSEVAMQGEIEVVDAPHGLFPKPYKPPKSAAKDKLVPPGALSWFNFMGRFVAQAILDERLLNLPLSRAFLRVLRGEKLAGDHVEVAQSFDFVREVDPAIAQSLSYLYTLATEASGEVDTKTKENLVDSMELAFTLVGDGSIELRPNGKNVSVSLANLIEYVRLNVSFLLHETIERQVAEFYDGFQVISGCSDTRKFLQSFSLHELEFLMADKAHGDTMWDREGKELREHMVCDHGYSPQSRAIHDLVSILSELSLADQRLFVKFVTGANRLPLGGLAKLEPKLTVVRKLASGDDGDATDAVLPSASTCTNYLKLPEYSTREAMRSRLMYCIYEGQGSFHLS